MSRRSEIGVEFGVLHFIIMRVEGEGEKLLKMAHISVKFILFGVVEIIVDTLDFGCASVIYKNGRM